MTDLYIVLFALAALIIVIVLVINWWQERKYRLAIEQNFASKSDDVLMPEKQLMHDNPTSNDIAFNNQIDSDTLADDAFIKHNARIDATDPKALNVFSQTHSDSSLRDIHNETFDAAYKDDSFPSDRDDFERIEPQFGEQDPAFGISKTIEDLDDANPCIITSSVDASNHESEVSLTEDIQVEFDGELDLVSPYVLDDYVNEHGLTEIDEKQSDTTKFDDIPENFTDSSSHLEVTLPKELHGQIDLIALLYLVSEASLVEIKPHLNPLLNSHDKPTSIFTLGDNNAWLTLTATEALPSALDTFVSRICCSMQLADRTGAVSRSTLQGFQADVDRVGLALNAQVVWQNAFEAQNTANTLDAFCAEVDQTVRFHLKHGEKGAFTGTKLRGLAEAQGFIVAENGAFKFFDAVSNRLLFSMVNIDNYPFNPDMLSSSVIKGVTFELDIPHVKNCTEVFSQMVQVARHMEMALNAVLVDDNQKMLGDVQVEKIRQQLKVIHAKMLVKGIVPGSDEASRLFA